jgi:hypothetical protein
VTHITLSIHAWCLGHAFALPHVPVFHSPATPMRTASQAASDRASKLASGLAEVKAEGASAAASIAGLNAASASTSSALELQGHKLAGLGARLQVMRYDLGWANALRVIASCCFLGGGRRGVPSSPLGAAVLLLLTGCRQ